SDERRKEIEKLAGKRASFLPRRMYENYLLHPKALATLLTEIDPSGDHSAEKVAEWIEANETRHRKGAPDGAAFQTHGHAAGLLKALFSDMTETRAQYDKVEHGPQLTRWLLQNDASAIAELKSFVGSLVAAVSEPNV